MTRPIGAKLLKDLTKDNPDFRKALENEFGVPYDQIERFTTILVQPDIEEGLIFLFYTSKPYAEQQVRKVLMPRAVKKEHEGKTYYFDRGSKLQTLYLINDRIYLAGPERAVKSFLDAMSKRKAEGRLTEALRLGAGKHHVSAGWALPPALVKAWGQNVPRESATFKPLLDARLGTLVVTLGEETRLDFRLHYADADGAHDGAKAARAAIALAREEVSQWVKLLAKDTDAPKTVQFLKQVQAALKKVSVEDKGLVVRAPIRIETDPDTVHGSFKEAVAKVRNAAERTESMNNLRQLALALHDYHSVNKHFPTAAIRDKNGKPLYSWRVAVLPYLDEEALYKQFRINEPWDSAHNKKLLAKMPKVFAVEGNKFQERGKTFYQAIVGKGAGFEGDKGLRLFDDFPDGSTCTILLVEAAEAVPWTKPVDVAFVPDKPLPKFGGLLKHGFSAVFADGSVRFLSKDIKEKTLRALITRNGGEVIDPRDYP
jgi:hypothetical protein